jgi:CDGSH-type Zn-finger protein
MKEEKKGIQKTEKPKIKVSRNGPYLASGGIPLAEQKTCVDADDECHGWKEGKKYPAQDNYTLCRCGHSQSKPFCDGAHVKVKFEGKETAANIPYEEQAREYDGPDLQLTDAEDFCADARFCHRGGGTWKLTLQSGDPGARQKAIEEARDCPSGRLVARDKDGKAIEPGLNPSIGLVEDTQAKKMGPIWVMGGIPVQSADGKTYEIRDKITLCRCGKSLNKPFCDGSHME